MNAMKKIFLLSLLSVFFLTAFSQISGENTEILTKISINRSADAAEIEQGGERFPWFPWWWPFYRWVRTEPYPGGIRVTCEGIGFMWCFPQSGYLVFRGISNEVVENTIEEMISDIGEQAENGESIGTITKKIATADGQSFLLFLMNWENDPKNNYNGRAEIIISKTNDFGVR
jgi:hypothetical protein